MCGNGRPAPICPIPASRRRPARSASITASSCAASSCSGAAPARRRRAMCGGPIAISSTPISAGSSSACAWPARRVRRRVMASDIALYLPIRRDRLDGGLARRGRAGGAGEFADAVLSGLARQPAQHPVPLLLRCARLGAVRGDHPLRRSITRPGPRPRCSRPMARRSPRWPVPGRILVEFGSGSSRKTSLLLERARRGAGLYPDRHRRREPERGGRVAVGPP